LHEAWISSIFVGVHCLEEHCIVMPEPDPLPPAAAIRRTERMHSKRLEVGVSFDPRLPHSVSALSLSGLRRRIEAALLPDEPVIQLRLDAVAERERRRRRSRAVPPRAAVAALALPGLLARLLSGFDGKAREVGALH